MNNSSNVLKKTLPLLIILLLIIGIAITCTSIKRTKDNPVFSDKDAVYLTASEDNNTYTVNKGEVYDDLKESVGLSTLINEVNKVLLKEYYNKVTDEDVQEEFDKGMFPDGKDDLTEEEIKEAEEEFYDTMFSSLGLNTEEEIKDYYRLNLAKKAYAREQLAKEIEEQDEKAEEDSDKFFKESDYSTYYNANYQQEFWAIIVPFTTEAQAKNALAQLGISIHKRQSGVEGDFDHWVWKAEKVEGEEPAEEVALTAKEVVKAMIDMYNTVYAYKLPEYPNERIVLNEGKQYSFDEFVNYEFNTTLSEEDETLNVLHYTYTELSNYQSSILNSMRNTWVAYTAESEADSSAKWFTVNPVSYNSGSLYCFVLKIAEEQPQELDSVRSEIFDALVDQKLTTAYIEEKMGNLRKEKKLVIYDTDIESAYISSMSTYKVDVKKTKASSKDKIASFEGGEVSVNDLFELMDAKYGASAAISILNYKRLMINKEYNEVYDFLGTGKEKDKWLDTDRYNELKDELAQEKLSFTAGYYASLGYDPSTMSWTDFLASVYGETDENLVLVRKLYSDILSDIQTSYGDLKDADEDSELWKFYSENMQKMVDEYFNVKGVHLLICVYNDPKDATSSSSTQINPEEWTEEQITLAKELHNQIITYLENTQGTIQEKMQAIATAFSTGLRFLPTLEQNVEAQPVIEGVKYVFDNIEVAKFRSAGLSVIYQDLGSFTNGKMVEAFNDVVKGIWDENPTSESMVIYKDYLQTEFGFHIYANLSSTAITEWTNDEEGDKEVKGVLPTLEYIKKYIEDSSDEDLTTSIKTAITTYYTPIYNELTGSNNLYIHEYQAIQKLNVNLQGANYSSEIWNKVLTKAIESWSENFKYVKVEGAAE